MSLMLYITSFGCARAHRLMLAVQHTRHVADIGVVDPEFVGHVAGVRKRMSKKIKQQTFVKWRSLKNIKYCKQNRESTEGYSKSIVRKNNDKFGKVLVSTSRTYASPKQTGPGVRRSKRPLSACHTRRKCSMETTKKSVKGRVRYKV